MTDTATKKRKVTRDDQGHFLAITAADALRNDRTDLLFQTQCDGILLGYDRSWWRYTEQPPYPDWLKLHHAFVTINEEDGYDEFKSLFCLTDTQITETHDLTALHNKMCDALDANPGAEDQIEAEYEWLDDRTFNFMWGVASAAKACIDKNEESWTRKEKRLMKRFYQCWYYSLSFRYLPIECGVMTKQIHFR